MGRKQASLSLRVSLEPNPPAVILLQEPGKKPVKIKDYATIEGDQYVATLVHKTYAATRLDWMAVSEKRDRGVHVVNVYGNPKHHKTDYRRLIAKVVKEAGKDPVVIAGDFNAPHPGWGYKYVSPKGRRLAESINQERLTLLTEVDQPTRTGTSSCRDTCPDLTLVKNVANAEWTNLMEQLVRIHKKDGKGKNNGLGPMAKQRGKGAASIENIEDWSSEVIASVKPFVLKLNSQRKPQQWTRVCFISGSTTRADQEMEETALQQEAEEEDSSTHKAGEDYAVDLARKNWYGLCDSIRRSLGTAQAWRMLRALIDPSRAKALYAISTKIFWERGLTPDSWKAADIRFIPKPKKELKLENLRPISLTSCLGKAFERVINSRVMKYLDKEQLLPNTQFGFRPHTSTQDILLWIYKDILENPRSGQTRCLLALDLKGAFDNVSHESIFRGLSTVNCGRRTFEYVRSFLTDRTATLTLGSIQSGTYRLGSRGTPQGAVLSPLLFNLALRGLPEALRAVPNVEHAIYADDITLWCREGSDAEIEEKLQAAADIVGEYAMRCGLKCAPEKSELLVFRNPRDKLVDHIDVVIDGVRVPKPAEVRILGQLLQQGRGNKPTIDRLDAMTTQVCGMMRRIRNRRHGLKEKEAIQLVQAFIIARLTYGTPYLNLNKAEMQKLNVLIRRAYKNALGLPERTATEKLLKLGVHNTIEELHEAQLVSQLKRLSSTVNGAWLLDKLGMAVPGGSHGPGDAGEELPAETRQRFTISRIPRNMHPDRNAERRQARAVALARSWDSREGTLYVDGAGPMLGVAAIAVASAQGQIRRIASIRAQTVEQVEEAAIALAVVCNPRATIISDSQRACQNFARGVVGQPALRLLRKTAVEGVHLIWTPGHMGQVGNEAANAAARGALYRDSVLPQRDLDSALTYSEALKALRTHRAEYPGPAKGLSKEEEFTWRRLQTDTFVTPIQLHLWYPERYATADCPFCGEPWVDVYHVVWACKNLPGLAPVEEPKLEEWEAGLKCATASEQRLLVARALRVHSALGAPE
ncbi:hypothetical protein HPB47_003783 [Ixodes persulcatus]|uniref:Uncharacterized protein n=1 Tax=Ixodes persulcatus TaxID=34615 RepID=A0AC60PHH4_IXOPE|nr:hypothetical protein HPB47_003783 [Ixodes persulcatus]